VGRKKGGEKSKERQGIKGVERREEG